MRSCVDERVKFIKRVDIDRINRLDRFRKLTFRPNGFVITDYKCQGARFSKVPRLFGRNSGDIILCIFKTKASRGTKLCSYFDFYSLYNIWTDQLFRLSRSEFHEWIFGPEKFSGRSRNGPLGSVSQKFRNLSGLFRVLKFPWYLRNAEVRNHQTPQCS